MERLRAWATKGLKNFPHSSRRYESSSSTQEVTAITLEMAAPQDGTMPSVDEAPDYYPILENLEQGQSRSSRLSKLRRGNQNVRAIGKMQSAAPDSTLLFTAKTILFSSYLNILLVFVPVGIAVEATHQHASIVFAMNAIAILPLSALLSHATESVAKTMGDTIGALMNVTFGNAVELIIFITALAKDEIRIVQASLLGSILVNLLLILGVAFFVGGLRYREQVYNSTVTQMSACLLSLSVMSLLLPTAFHASFKDVEKADEAVLKLSRGTSVILLLVYGLYLLFQLRSHSYMYESTPQHIIDESTRPGPAARWMDSSSSENSYSDSESSLGSRHTSRRSHQRSRSLRHRDSSTSESGSDIDDQSTFLPRPEPIRVVGHKAAELGESRQSITFSEPLRTYDDSDGNDATSGPRSTIYVDREVARQKKGLSQHKKKQRQVSRARNEAVPSGTTAQITAQTDSKLEQADNLLDDSCCIDFTLDNHPEAQPALQPNPRPFSIRSISMKPSIRKALSENVFMQPLGPSRATHIDLEASTSQDSARRARARSLSCSCSDARGVRGGGIPSLHLRPVKTRHDQEEDISRVAAVILLLISTTLVAICADFMVEAIDEATTGTGLSATFVGLIILPIVGNAAEYITCVSVAVKNKMDLANGVAIGSSIQIALFLTPVVVLLGWCMGKQMTLYFTLFETVSLFASAFIVGFLVLDGRSNYLEGALLMAAYVIIAVASFYYPEEEFQSVLGGNPGAQSKMTRGFFEFGS